MRRYIHPYGIIYPTIVVNGSGEWHPWTIPQESVKLPNIVKSKKMALWTVWAPRQENYDPHVWGNEKDRWAKWKVGRWGTEMKKGGQVLHVEGLCNATKLGQACRRYGYNTVVLTGYPWPPEYLKWIREKLGLKIWLETPKVERILVPAESDALKDYEAYNELVEGYIVTDDGEEDLIAKVKNELLYRGIKNHRIIVQCAREGREQKALLRFVRDAKLGGVWAIKEGMKTQGWHTSITIK